MFLLKGYNDYYNEQGQYRETELFFSTLGAAKDAAQRYQRALVISLETYRVVYSVGFSEGGERDERLRTTD